MEKLSSARVAKRQAFKEFSRRYHPSKRMDFLRENSVPLTITELELAPVIDGLARTQPSYLPSGMPQACHHNAASYVTLHPEAKHVVGWIDGPSAHLLHSVVEIDGALVDITPRVQDFDLPFAPDPELTLTFDDAGWVQLRRSGEPLPPADVRKPGFELPPTYVRDTRSHTLAMLREVRREMRSAA